jgi:hypothetical protein
VKVSVLIPTRDRLDYLRQAVESVRRQPGDVPFEVVVSDNASEQDVRGYVEGLGDERVRYVRTSGPVPVTDNWNNALEHSTGDWIIMLGDDDGLLSGALPAIAGLAERFRPEAIYTGAYLYAYPGVMPDEPRGYLQPYGYARFLRRRTEAFELDLAARRRLVREAMAFRLHYGFNMHRSLVERLADRGPFYQSRFPDYYAMNAAFWHAETVVADPRPMVAIGVTPRSYGFFHAQRREDEGRAFLEAGAAAAAAMPGSNINAGWLDAMETLARRHPEIGRGPDLGRYRRLQIAHVHEQVHLDRSLGDAELQELRAHLSPREARAWGAAGRAMAVADRVLPPQAMRVLRFLGDRAKRQLPYWPARRLVGRHASLLDVFEDRAVPGQPSLRKTAV